MGYYCSEYDSGAGPRLLAKHHVAYCTTTSFQFFHLVLVLMPELRHAANIDAEGRLMGWSYAARRRPQVWGYGHYGLAGAEEG